MYDVLEICNYIINYCYDNKKIITNSMLQKILYFLQAEFLVVKNEPCFEDKIEAWSNGPVIPKVFNEYKIYALLPITPNYLNKRSTSFYPIIPFCDSFDIAKKDIEIINDIVNNCLQHSPVTLTNITQKQTPWQKAWTNLYDNTISKESIKDFFKE